MNQKPSDLLLSVIDFFGILVPGSIFAFLYGDFLLSPLGVSLRGLETAANWVPAFFVSYVLGHFLIGFSVPFNRVAAWLPLKETKAYFNAVRDRVSLPAGVPPDHTNVFYSAFSRLRRWCSSTMIR